MKEITVDASTQNLDRVLDFLESNLLKAGFETKSINQVKIAAEEIFVNIAHYAYDSSGGTATVKFHFQREHGAEAACIEFVDSGKQYDPLLKKDPDISANAVDREIGGLGVYMTKRLMDGLDYAYEDGKNRLCLHKYKTPAKDGTSR